MSGVLGRPSCFGRVGRGDKGGLVHEIETCVDIRGGSSGREGGPAGCSTSTRVDELFGDSTVIIGFRTDKETVLLISCLGIVVNCGDRGAPIARVRSGGSIRGFGFSLGGTCGDELLMGRASTQHKLDFIRSIPSIFSCGLCSSTLRGRSLDVGFTTLVAFSSGPFLTSRAASCSNRDFNELTDERVNSSTDSESIVAG
jgi:hypothetical protein